MNIIFNNDMERIYLSSEYLFLKENEANDVEFKTFEEFWNIFNRNTFICGSNVDGDFRNKLKQKAENTYNIFINGKNKVN